MASFSCPLKQASTTWLTGGMQICSICSTRVRAIASRRVFSYRYVKHASTSNSQAHRPMSKDSRELRSCGPARTRFAPSPTGNLHLGSLRTALFNYLIAQATGGQFLLRIEDTDQNRTVPEAEERLYRDLEWAGLQWDEGPKVGGQYGPYIQSQRTAIYQAHANQLLESGEAYRCFCTPRRLHSLAEHRSKLGLPADYDRTCTHIPTDQSDERAANGESHVVRLKSPDKYPVYEDLIYGLVRQRQDMSKQREFFDDPILLKSDRFPTYHLANVVDDHLMQITHVVRGSEWMSSTPKHLALYKAFGWSPPKFAHVGLLVDKDKQKLSKRTGARDIAQWREKGIFPETLTNFVALLGWSHTESRDIMSLEDLVNNASLKFTKGDSIVSFEKLWFLQKRHAARYAFASQKNTYSPESHDLRYLATKPTVQALNDRSKKEDLFFYKSIPEGEAREDYVHSLILADASNYTTPHEFINRNIHFFMAPSAEKLLPKVPQLCLHKIPSEISDSPPPKTFFTLFDILNDIAPESWNAKELKTRVDWIIEQGVSYSVLELKESTDEAELIIKKSWSKMVHQYLRWALLNGKSGPDGAETLRILGKTETLARMKLANSVFEENESKDPLDSADV